MFFTTGLAYLMMTIVYLLSDRTKKWRGDPFFHLGQNSIIIYIVHEVF